MKVGRYYCLWQLTFLWTALASIMPRATHAVWFYRSKLYQMMVIRKRDHYESKTLRLKAEELLTPSSSIYDIMLTSQPNLDDGCLGSQFAFSFSAANTWLCDLKQVISLHRPLFFHLEKNVSPSFLKRSAIMHIGICTITAKRQRTAWKVNGPIWSIPTLCAMNAEPHITVQRSKSTVPLICLFIYYDRSLIINGGIISRIYENFNPIMLEFT